MKNLSLIFFESCGVHFVFVMKNLLSASWYHYVLSFITVLFNKFDSINTVAYSRIDFNLRSNEYVQSFELTSLCVINRHPSCLYNGYRNSWNSRWLTCSETGRCERKVFINIDGSPLLHRKITGAASKPFKTIITE